MTKEEYMTTLVDEWLESNYNLSEFSAMHDMEREQFRYWTRKFGYTANKEKKLDYQKSEVPFLDVSVVSPQQSGSPISLVYPNGVRLEINDRIDHDELSSLIKLF